MSKDEARKLYTKSVKGIFKDSKVIPFDVIMVWNIMTTGKKSLTDTDVKLMILALTTSLKEKEEGEIV